MSTIWFQYNLLVHCKFIFYLFVFKWSINIFVHVEYKLANTVVLYTHPSSDTVLFMFYLKPRVLYKAGSLLANIVFIKKHEGDHFFRIMSTVACALSFPSAFIFTASTFFASTFTASIFTASISASLITPPCRVHPADHPGQAWTLAPQTPFLQSAAAPLQSPSEHAQSACLPSMSHLVVWRKPRCVQLFRD